jgi:hypothetical protein
MAFNIDNVVLDRVLRVTKQSISSGDIEWTANQIADGSLECGGEEVQAVDGVGSPIGSFDRTKTSKFSCTNSVLNLGVLADQMGTEKEVASSTKKIVTRKVDILEPVTEGGKTTLTLTYAPVSTSPITAVWALTSEGGLGTKYEISATSDASKATVAGKVITLGTDIPTTDDNGETISFIAIYQAELDAAVKLTNKSDNFTKIGAFVIDCIMHDVCDPSTKYYGMIIFDRAKLSNSFTIDIKPDGTQPIEFEGYTKYCAKNKEQFYVVIPEDVEDVA